MENSPDRACCAFSRFHQAFVYVCVCAHMCVCVCVCVRVCVCIWYMHVCILYIYIYMHPDPFHLPEAEDSGVFEVLRSSWTFKPGPSPGSSWVEFQVCTCL